MRTNIVIDDVLMAEAMEVAGTTTKRETVDRALRELVARRERLRVLELVGKLDWEGDLDQSRKGRSF